MEAKEYVGDIALAPLREFHRCGPSRRRSCRLWVNRSYTPPIEPRTAPVAPHLFSMIRSSLSRQPSLGPFELGCSERLVPDSSPLFGACLRGSTVPSSARNSSLFPCWHTAFATYLTWPHICLPLAYSSVHCAAVHFCLRSPVGTKIRCRGDRRPAVPTQPWQPKFRCSHLQSFAQSLQLI